MTKIYQDTKYVCDCPGCKQEWSNKDKIPYTIQEGMTLHNNDYHFCSLECLEIWLFAQRIRNEHNKA